MVNCVDDPRPALEPVSNRRRPRQPLLSDHPSLPEPRTELPATDEASGHGEIQPSASDEVAKDGVSHTFAHKRKGIFLAAYRETGLIAVAARIAGVARRTHYDWLENDPAC
jgi:hypothetical protein